LKRLVYLPVKLFESPVILMILDGQNIGEYFNPSNFIFPNLLGLFALVLFIRIRKTMEKEVRIIGYGLLISTFILASPLIGIDWANRLYMMSYIPIVGVYLILFSRITKKWILAFPVVIFCSIMCFVIFEGFTSPMLQSITDEAYQEFKEIKSDVNLTENTAIVARQDLKVLASWEFGTKGIANYLLTENDFLSFESVYYLIQKKGINYTREETWRKLKIPANSLIVFKGDYFDLYKVENIDGSTPVIIGRSKAKGVIISLDSDGFILQNGITGKKKTVIISDNTQLYFSTDQNELKNGMEVEIWGEGIPFSLNLKAQTIVELK
jgi:energy-coupling factor transporter transmembrane protein EcfT